MGAPILIMVKGAAVVKTVGWVMPSGCVRRTWRHKNLWVTPPPTDAPCSNYTAPAHPLWCCSSIQPFLIGSSHFHLWSASTSSSCFVLSLCTLTNSLSAAQAHSLIVLSRAKDVLWFNLKKTAGVVGNLLATRACKAIEDTPLQGKMHVPAIHSPNVEGFLVLEVVPCLSQKPPLCIHQPLGYVGEGGHILGGEPVGHGEEARGEVLSTGVSLVLLNDRLNVIIGEEHLGAGYGGATNLHGDLLPSLGFGSHGRKWEMGLGVY